MIVNGELFVFLKLGVTREARGLSRVQTARLQVRIQVRCLHELLKLKALQSSNPAEILTSARGGISAVRVEEIAQ
jgi:hypothetical protein